MKKNNGEITLEEYNMMLNELLRLKKYSNNYEKMALDYYIQEVESLIRNEKDITEIKRIVEPYTLDSVNINKEIIKIH